MREEQHDAELATNEALTALVDLLNTKHIAAQQALEVVISKSKYDIAKKGKLNEELKIMRNINDVNKFKIQKHKEEKKEFEKQYNKMKSKLNKTEDQLKKGFKERKEMENKYRSMVSTKSSLEA